MMTTTWPKEQLQSMAQTDDLHISPFREDGKTYGTPTWIWSVVVDDQLYVRAYNGQSFRWYQAAMQQEAGRITAGVSRRRSDSSRWMVRSTIKSMMRTAPNIEVALILIR